MSPGIDYDSYDEPDVFVDYLFDNKDSLMTEDEQAAAEAMIVRMQAEELVQDGEEEAAQQLLMESGQLDNEVINRLLDGGQFAFQKRVVDRVLLAELEGEIRINRCPSCERIARTALAKQCLWCGESWR